MLSVFSKMSNAIDMLPERLVVLSKKSFVNYLKMLQLVKTQKENQLVSRILLRIPGFFESVVLVLKQLDIDVASHQLRNVILNTLANDPSAKYWLGTCGLKFLLDILITNQSQSGTKQFHDTAGEGNNTVSDLVQAELDHYGFSQDYETESNIENLEENDQELQQELPEEHSLIIPNLSSNAKPFSVSNSEKTNETRTESCCPHCSYQTRNGHLKRHIRSKHKNL